LNVSGTVRGEQVADDQGVDFVPSQDNPYPFPGFSVYLEGLAKEEDREFTLTVPEDFHDTTIAGKECLFKVKALEIKTKNLPELDDEFAKGIEDGYEGLEALRTSILENLTADSERLSTRDFQEKALEEVISGASIEISEATMEREIDHLLEDQARGQQGRQGDVETYVQNAGKTREELREELRPAATERLHRYLVIRKISQDEGLEVSPEEVDTEVEELTASASGSSEALLQAFSSEDARSSLGSAILTRKVLERLIQRIEEPEEAPTDSLETEGEAEGESEPEVTEEPMDDSPTVEENAEEEPSESST
jgi:trigger factor